MGIDYIYPPFEVVRDPVRCINCRLCEKQCANGVHGFDKERGFMTADESRCVDCQRCVCFCPTHALKIRKSDCALRDNANWDEDTVQEIYKQAGSGGVLLSSMGNPKRYPVYWDRILVNASQVTNPPVDPLREPMETRVFLGRKPDGIRRDEAGQLVCTLPPQIELSMPVMFSAMSYGSISYNAHACLAQAAQELGICYNTGEGGLHEDFYAYGDSTIVQVASGRFGVHKQYLEAGAAIEIKMGQGAKPGIGGHLPGAKIVGDVSRTRMVPEGTDAISPAPHHDIYSIEDLAQLIFDLKKINPTAAVSVKLVAESGVGTVAAGVAKAKADLIVISGAEGGTGASPASSMRFAGISPEIGLAETQQTLVLNGLRGQVRLQTDGQLKTARDVILMAMLGADEFSFGTLPLIVLGCVMMRKCNTNTCPVGVATQDERLRAKFRGRADYVVNFFTFLAEQTREYLAAIGVRHLKEIIGRTDLIEVKPLTEGTKQQTLDFSRLLRLVPSQGLRYWDRGRTYSAPEEFDERILQDCAAALAAEGSVAPVTFDYDIRNTDRAVGTALAGQIAKARGNEAYANPETFNLRFRGSAGQSFGAFAVRGMNLRLEGEANDYFGKGLSGGHISILPSEQRSADFAPEDNIIAGNTGLYGATSGELYVNGRVGERFAVRNSGAIAVIEGAGDHCCEYMTGGRVVVLGTTGRNFAAGMSGGLAYVWDHHHDFDYFCNMDQVEIGLVEEATARKELRELVRQHYLHTGSPLAQRMLNDWNAYIDDFIQVTPIEYKRVLHEEQMRQLQAKIANMQIVND